MKKTVTLMIALIMLTMTIAGCGSGERPPETSATTTKETVASSGTTSTEATTSAETTTETTAAETTTETTTTTETPVIDPKDDGLILHFQFESIDNGIIADVSGNGHDGIVSSKPSIVGGYDGNAISFTSQNQHITVADSSDLNFTADDSFTLEVWFKWSETFNGSNWPCIVQKGLVISEKAYKYVGFWISSSTKKVNLGLSGNGGTGISNFSAKDEVGTEWHHAVAIQNAESGTINFYIDGLLQASMSAIDASSAGRDLTIGYNGFDGQYIGLIDDLKIFNYAKDESEYESDLVGVDKMAAKVYEYTDETTGKYVALPYRVYLPSDYNAENAEKYPILLFLHGYGECGSDNALQIRVLGSANELLDRVIERDDCIILAPQCTSDAENLWVPLNYKWATGSRSALTENPTISLAAATSLLKTYIGGGKVNTDRVYAAGLSMGGYGTWEILLRNPDLFAAVIPVCGAGVPSMAASIKNVAIWAFHGEADPTVPVSGTRDMEKAIKTAGGEKIKATYYAGVGHNSWIPAFAEADLTNWLFSQSK